MKEQIIVEVCVTIGANMNKMHGKQGQQWHSSNSAVTNQNCSVLGKAIEMFSLAVAQWNSKLANELQSSEFLKP